MRRQQCTLCGKIRLTEVRQKRWVCPACRKKAEYLLDNPNEIPQKACRKCKTLKKDRCPFTETERREITYCTKFEHKDGEHNKKRWEKYGF